MEEEQVFNTSLMTTNCVSDQGAIKELQDTISQVCVQLENTSTKLTEMGYLYGEEKSQIEKEMKSLSTIIEQMHQQLKIHEEHPQVAHAEPLPTTSTNQHKLSFKEKLFEQLLNQISSTTFNEANKLEIVKALIEHS